MQAHDGAGTFGAGHAGQINPDEFRGTAADIDHQKLFGFGGHQRRTGHNRKPRFFFGLDDVELQARFTPDVVHELLAIGGAPARFGCDQTHTAHAVTVEFRATHTQCLHRPAHRAMTKLARAFKAMTELNRLGKAVHDVKLVALGLGNQHPTTVRSQIQRRIKIGGIRFFRLRRRNRDRDGSWLRAQTCWALGRHGAALQFELHSAYVRDIKRARSRSLKQRMVSKTDAMKRTRALYEG